MAVKYIKADDVLNCGRDFLAGVLFVEKGSRGGKMQALAEALMKHITRNAPAEDVVAVVRCEKCAKREKKDEYFKCTPCGYRCNENDWYCPAGVRREDE